MVRQAIEYFHLIFCKNFLSINDKDTIALKGGCNLRFFFGSLRYSEDIDFEAEKISVETLKRRVDKLLSSLVLQNNLISKGIEIISVSAPKQTQTVQRWKITIRVNGLSVPTKIEFSRRGVDFSKTIFETIDPTILIDYKISSIFISHYNINTAISQKIDALGGRVETQSRDLFDLNHLISRSPQNIITLPEDIIKKAIDASMSIGFDQFRGQVVEFLSGDTKYYYDDERIFEDLKNKIISWLGSIYGSH